MNPYYQEDGITIYHCDNMEYCDDIKYDLLLTDPPYGIASVWKGGSRSGWANTAKLQNERNTWDAEAPSIETIMGFVEKCKESIIWGGNYFSLPPSRGWLVWNKPERNFTLSEAELAWSNIDMVVRVFDANRSDIGREHPTQKPLKLMSWCLTFAKKCRSVFDPYMGSGTTLVAAKNAGLICTGLEANEKYCEIAAKRLSQRVLPIF